MDRAKEIQAASLPRAGDALNERRTRPASAGVLDHVTHQLLAEPPLPLYNMWRGSVGFALPSSGHLFWKERRLPSHPSFKYQPVAWGAPCCDVTRGTARRERLARGPRSSHSPRTHPHPSRRFRNWAMPRSLRRCSCQLRRPVGNHPDAGAYPVFNGSKEKEPSAVPAGSVLFDAEGRWCEACCEQPLRR